MSEEVIQVKTRKRGCKVSIEGKKVSDGFWDGNYTVKFKVRINRFPRHKMEIWGEWRTNFQGHILFEPLKSSLLPADVLTTLKETIKNLIKQGGGL